MIITIAGKLGSGKSSVAKELAKKLNYKHYSIGDFMREIANEKEITLLELGKIAEKSREIDEKLDQKQIELGKNQDNFIIDSRIGYHFIPHSKRIFLDVELKTSAERIFSHMREDEKHNTDIKTTIKNIKKRFRSEKKRYKKYYSINNHHDPKHFDIVIDTTNISAEEVVDLILQKLKLN